MISGSRSVDAWASRRAAWLASDPEQIAAAARHEAAHVVVSARAGCVVQLVTIDPQQTAGRCGLCVVTAGSFFARLVGIVAAQRWDSMCGWFPPALVYETDHRAARAVAAVLADPHPLIGGALVRSVLEDRRTDPHLPCSELLARAQREADRLLNLPDTAVYIDAVARALLASGMLCRRRIRRLVGPGITAECDPAARFIEVDSL